MDEIFTKSFDSLLKIVMTYLLRERKTVYIIEFTVTNATKPQRKEETSPNFNTGFSQSCKVTGDLFLALGFSKL